MKLECKRCGCYLGELELGKIHKKAVMLCHTCMDDYRTFESLAGVHGCSAKAEMPEFFKDLFPK